MIVQTYNYGDGGLADTLRSMLAFYIFCKKHSITYYISFGEHPFSLCFSPLPPKIENGTKFSLFENMSGKTDIQMANFLKYISNDKSFVLPNNAILPNFVVRSNVFDFMTIKELEENKKEFLEYLNVTDRVKERIRDFGKVENFVAIHVRCGDIYMKEVNCGVDARMTPENAAKIIDKITKDGREREKFILFTDNYWLKEKYDHLCLNGIIHHTALKMGDKEKEIEGVIDCVAEFFAMGTAKKIITLTNSGFSFWSAFFHNVPIFEIGEDGIEREKTFENLKY